MGNAAGWYDDMAVVRPVSPFGEHVGGSGTSPHQPELELTVVIKVFGTDLGGLKIGCRKRQGCVSVEEMEGPQEAMLRCDAVKTKKGQFR